MYREGNRIRGIYVNAVKDVSYFYDDIMQIAVTLKQLLTNAFISRG
jgi:hypothetical protein